MEEDGVLRVDLESAPLHVGEAFLGATLEVVAGREEPERLGVGRIDLERLQEILLRAIEIAVGEPQRTESAPSARVVLVHFDGPLELFLSERVALGPDLEIDEVVLREKDEGIGIVSIAVEGPPEEVPRKRKVVLLEIGAAPLDEERQGVLVLLPRLRKHDVVRVVVAVQVTEGDAHLDEDFGR